ncbi:hypothetical protein QQX98_000736 [Neonectria punicea]|uniref:Uncharacterized protein n=1 Tax=Neonectria punicea TaxID=979145 RepID=A0ABR1HRP1_9HYPO
MSTSTQQGTSLQVQGHVNGVPVPFDPTFALSRSLHHDDPHHRAPLGFGPPRSIAASQKRMAKIIEELAEPLK